MHARPHLETHARGKGHSALAGVAYRLGLRLVDKRTGVIHDFRRRQLGEEIVAALTLAPKGAPAWASDPELVWNAVEAAEKRKDAQVGHDFRIPIPLGLSDQQAVALATSMAQYIVDDLHTIVSVGLHRDADRDALGEVKPLDKQGFHAHLYFPTRRLDFDEDLGGAGTEGQGGDAGWNFTKKLTVLAHKKTASACIEAMNERWAALANEHAAAQGLVADYTHLSYKRLGLETKAQPKLGAAATAMERRGVQTHKGDGVRYLLLTREALAATREAAMAQRRASLSESTHGAGVAVVAPQATGSAFFSDEPGDNSITVAAIRHYSPADLAPDRVPPTSPTVVPYFSYRKYGVAADATSSPRADADDLLTRFIKASPHSTSTAPANEEARQEARTWVMAIARALTEIFAVAKNLLSLGDYKARERTAHADMSTELHAHEQAARVAGQRVEMWTRAHTIRLSVAKVLRGKDAGPTAWRALLADAAACEDRVRTLKRVVAGHDRNLSAIAKDEAPLLSRQARQQQTLTEALEGLGDIGPIYVPQLLAAATEAERKWLAAAMPKPDTSDDQFPAEVDKTCGPKLLPKQSLQAASGVSMLRPSF
jgi:MobA/MobL family protein